MDNAGSMDSEIMDQAVATVDTDGSAAASSDGTIPQSGTSSRSEVLNSAPAIYYYDSAGMPCSKEEYERESPTYSQVAAIAPPMTSVNYSFQRSIDIHEQTCFISPFLLITGFRNA